MTATKAPILLATRNPAKQERFRWLLEGLPLEPLTRRSLTPRDSQINLSHLSSAKLKAEISSHQVQGLAIASTGGATIPSLGRYWKSHRTGQFAIGYSSDYHKAQGLLDLMQGNIGDERRVSWHEALAIAHSGTLLKSWNVDGAEGIIAESIFKGEASSGFWVTRLWYFPQLGKYYPEASDKELITLGDHWWKLRRMVREYIENKLPFE